MLINGKPYTKQELLFMKWLRDIRYEAITEQNTKTQMWMCSTDYKKEQVKG